MSNEKGLKRISLNDLLFPVEKVLQTDFSCNSDYAYDIFGYINGIKTRLNSCSERYELIPNEDIFKTASHMLVDNNIDFTAKYYHLNYARFYADYEINNYEFKISANDIVKPMLRIQHSYNGLTKYMITFGYYRLVCTNGLTIPVKEKKEFNLSISGKHTTNIKKSIGTLFNTIQYFINNGNTYINRFKFMADQIVVNPKDRITEVLNVAGISINNMKYGINAVDYIINQMNEDFKKLPELQNKVNDWIIYNGINHYINNNDYNMKSPEVRTEIDSNVLSYMLIN